MIIDTHSHLNFKAYDNDREEVIQRTQKEGVVCIDVGTKYETSKNAIELAEKNENIYVAIGMHPIHINPVRNSPPIGPSSASTPLEAKPLTGQGAGVISNGVKTDSNEGDFGKEEYNKERYRELAKSDKVIAIGEIGLDYYYKPKTTVRLEQFKELQKKVFIEQLDLAKELDLPVIIHCRMAHTDVLDILKSQISNPNDQKLRGVIHCFTGNLEQAKKFIDLGFYIGINGIIFKLDLDEVIKNIPLNKILVETDCPYLTPPEAGVERNEPIFVKHVIQKIADLKGMSFDEIIEATTANAIRLFKLDQSR